MTLEQRVRNQILEEGPQFEHANFAEAYVDDKLAEMPRHEFLQRISNELDKLLGDAGLL